MDTFVGDTEAQVLKLVDELGIEKYEQHSHGKHISVRKGLLNDCQLYWQLSRQKHGIRQGPLAGWLWFRLF